MDLIVWILNTFEITAFLTGLYFYTQLEKKYLKLFVALLGFIVLTELLGKYFKYNNQSTISNTILYGYISIPIQFIGYYWLYSKRNSNRIIFVVPTMLYLGCLLLEYISIKGKDYIFSNLTYTLGNILLLIIIVHYLYKLITSHEILHFKKDPFFWISIGQLIFYLPTIPFYFFLHYIREANLSFYINYYYFAISLNCIMYVCYSLSFIWNKNN